MARRQSTPWSLGRSDATAATGTIVTDEIAGTPYGVSPSSLPCRPTG
jgi:hypothetical protein